ncbi:ribonuclease R [Profundibacterium mesophilum]|uniref:Ribonuclease R n=1 Tax=Profundibacterium mesophilum KAUST100406-0324 TaxID=1037889 RepID=A0A921TFI4_9RHOB|nr:ribonuclease R [Profundibacterium mesophilum]KAF0676484.1 Ribonuclease R [Profundibacterium mesophilum KAUST100406-0324]
MTRIPSKAEILEWISQNPTQTSKRDIARAFGIKGAARIELKQLLRALAAEGHLEKRKKTYRDPETLPPVSVCEVVGPDADGDLSARPLEFHGSGPEPRIALVARDGDPALGAGERVLLRLTAVDGEDHAYEGRLIRRIGGGPDGGADGGPRTILGIFRSHSEGGRIVPIDKKQDLEWMIPEEATGGAQDGELVEARQSGPRNRMGLPRARVVARLGDPSQPRAVSLIAIHQHGIPDAFPAAVTQEAERAKPAGLSGREDLRGMPFVTIDPHDARDHDDACMAEPDTDPGNPGGHILWVAIADVAHYVRPGSALDAEALKRGNSTYFPDRVVPMLPDRLSGDLCSLHEDVPRACIAVRMVLDADGNKIAHRFVRGLMRSAASLHYEEVQAARDGTPSARTEPLMETVITPLYGAFEALRAARARRQPLDLELPERKIELDAEGRVASIAFRKRLDAHKMIEEFMILANVAAAEELITRRTPLLFRVHEEPTAEKLEALREVAQASGMTLAKGQVLQTRHLNALLAQAEATTFDELINMSTLRAMTQAYYSPENFGHFGLALRSYAHFTSPIRRYADLVVHRALVSAHGWGEGGLSAEEVAELEATAKHISETERRSMVAERDTNDRYLAAFLSERMGSEAVGRISGIQRFGLFVKLDETGADGLVPIGSISGEYWRHDAEAQTLTGSDSGLVLALGQKVTVRLAEATPETGGLVLQLLEIEGDPVAQGSGSRGRGSRRPGAGAPTRRKAVRAKAKADKTRKKVKRTRR